MRRLGQFYRDRSGLAGVDFALIMAMMLAGRHIALCHGAQIGAALKPLLGA